MSGDWRGFPVVAPVGAKGIGDSVMVVGCVQAERAAISSVQLRAYIWVILLPDMRSLYRKTDRGGSSYSGALRRNQSRSLSCADFREGDGERWWVSSWCESGRALHDGARAHRLQSSIWGSRAYLKRNHKTLSRSAAGEQGCPFEVGTALQPSPRFVSIAREGCSHPETRP